MLKYDLYPYILMISFVSFLGWIVENIWLLFTKGYMDNRNMHLPFLLGYGLYIIAFYAILGIPSHCILLKRLNSRKKIYFVYFLITFVAVSVGELILGHLVEHFFHFEYWNYTKIPFHFTKYTSLPTSAAFALGITFFMDKCFMPLMNFLRRIPATIGIPLATILLYAMMIDFFISFKIFYKKQGPNKIWQYTLPHKPFTHSADFLTASRK